MHGAVHDSNADRTVWMAPADCTRLGLTSGSEVVLHTTSASVQVPVLPVADVVAGTVVLPHGIPTANVNALIPTGVGMLEPVSGQRRMTGIAVQLTLLPAVNDADASPASQEEKHL
jgi:anaerobic selenocysteine-containing dehydrogenase